MNIAGILPIRHKTLNNQSINQSINHLYFTFVKEFVLIKFYEQYSFKLTTPRKHLVMQLSL